ncbi:hypothetical protein [Nocardia sp. CDC160]|uniref:hypothetical protein n=1 Tax=Nocardia sp. CDC160 TaxID=3112166 RepID=UPI002DBC784A|nr:hypothetical protein [Nocardia sp. CDC160]MEC3916400.1 hypothetical protein [Nocardia sp. CDC160]
MTELMRKFARWAVPAVCLSILPIHVIAASADEMRTETIVESDGDLTISHVRLFDPLPAGTPPHPAACDWVDYLRYRPSSGAADPQESDAVILSQVGAWLGASSMDLLARNTIHALEARGKKVEWWSQPRRTSCLFDDTGLRAAADAHDGRVAFDYYYGDRIVEGHRFAGFQSNADLGWLADMGLARYVQDMHTVLTRELPDPNIRRTKAFCGGTSDGGLIAGAFAAWDFGGGDEGAGYNQCAAFLGIDSLISTDPIALESIPVVRQLAQFGSGLPYLAQVAALHAGILPVSFTGIPYVEPRFYTLLAVLGAAAHYAPDEETDLHRRLPTDWITEASTRLAFSATYADLLGGGNALRDYRFTNTALLGMLLGDHTLNVGPMQFSIGALDGGPVIDKTVPWPDNPNSPLSAVTGQGPRVAPADKNALYTWRDYDQLDGIDYAPPGSEVVSIRDLARALAAAPGESVGFLDPYFAPRFLIDIQSAFTGARLGDLAPIRYDDRIRQRPILTTVGTKSWIGVAKPLFPADTVYLPNYTHTDVNMGATHQVGDRPEAVSATVADFLLRNLR